MTKNKITGALLADLVQMGFSLAYDQHLNVQAAEIITPDIKLSFFFCYRRSANFLIQSKYNTWALHGRIKISGCIHLASVCLKQSRDWKGVMTGLDGGSVPQTIAALDDICLAIRICHGSIFVGYYPWR